MNLKSIKGYGFVMLVAMLFSLIAGAQTCQTKVNFEDGVYPDTIQYFNHCHGDNLCYKGEVVNSVVIAPEGHLPYAHFWINRCGEYFQHRFFTPEDDHLYVLYQGECMRTGNRSQETALNGIINDVYQLQSYQRKMRAFDSSKKQSLGDDEDLARCGLANNKQYFGYQIFSFSDSVTASVQREQYRSLFGYVTEIIGIPFVEVLDGQDTDMLIGFDKMDGTGGDIAQVSAYNCDDVESAIRVLVFDIEESFDFLDDIEGDGRYDFLTVLLHETGHLLGLPHEYFDRRSVMVEDYQGIRRQFSEGDIEALQQHYVFDRIVQSKYFHAFPNSQQKVSKNFKLYEFASKCPDLKQSMTQVDERVAKAVQLIRDHFGHPVKITSSHRSHTCNKNAGGAIASSHLNHPTIAIDFKFLNDELMNQYNFEISTEDCLFKSLYELGVRGFGLYPDHGHIDFRVTAKSSDYAIWDNSNPNKMRAFGKGC